MPLLFVLFQPLDSFQKMYAGIRLHDYLVEKEKSTFLLFLSVLLEQQPRHYDECDVGVDRDYQTVSNKLAILYVYYKFLYKQFDFYEFLSNFLIYFFIF